MADFGLLDSVDIQDYAQQPIISSRIRCRSFAGSLRGQLRASGQQLPNAASDAYFSFTKCIREEAPAHYLQYYIDYEECKDLVRHLESCRAALLSGNEPENIPTKVRRMVNDSLGSLLSSKTGYFDEKAATAIVPQVINNKMEERKLNNLY